MNSQTRAKIGIISASSMMNSLICISLMLSGAAAALPDATTLQIQNIYTFAYAANLLGTLASGVITNYMPKKKLIIIACIFGGTSGVCGLLLHNSLIGLYVASCFAGIGAGAVSVVTVVIAENFADHERASVMGIQSVALNLMGTVIGVVAGLLASKAWYYPFGIYFFFFVIILFVVIFLPNSKVETGKKTVQTTKNPRLLTPAYIKILIIAFLYGAINLTFSMNLTFIASDSSISGHVTSVYTICGCLIGLAAGKIYQKFGKHTTVLGTTLILTSYMLLSIMLNTPSLLVGAILYGVGYSIFAVSIKTDIADTIPAENLTLGYQLYSTVMLLGMTLHSYLVTMPASLLGDAVAARFVWSSILIAVIITISLTLNKKE